MYQCQECFNYQEELLDLNNGCGHQIPCFCFSPEELFAQHLARQNIVNMPDDSQLEEAMMVVETIVSSQSTDDNKDIDFVVERLIIDLNEYVDGDIIDISDDEEDMEIIE